MSTIKISHLKLMAIFTLVVEHNSFAAAARALNTSRSRVSEQVSSLESALGVRLLQRSTRKLLLTEEGQKVFAQSVQLNQILKNVEASVAPDKPAGRVRISMNHDIAHQFFLPIFSKFNEQFPDVVVDLVLDDAPKDLIAEQIDVAIRIGFPKDSSLVARPLFEDCFRLYASPQFISRFGEPESLRRLEMVPWVVLSQVFADGIVSLQYQGNIIQLRPQKVTVCNSPYMVQRMVTQGVGVSTLLPCTVAEEISNQKLLPIMPLVESEKLIFSIVYPSRKHLPSRTRCLVDFILQNNPFVLQPRNP